MESTSWIPRIVSIAGNLIAIGLGIFALRHWARQGIPARIRWKCIGVDFHLAAKKEFAIGFAIGTVAMLGIFVVEVQAGLTEVISLRWPVTEIMKLAVMIAILAAMEELVFRGFMMNGILVLRPEVWIALAGTALLFGLVHAANANATGVTVISAMIGGVMYGVAFLWTRRLWMPWGLHVAWNFVQGPLLGFPVSGLRWESIVQQTVSGPAFLTGGEYGPEGGLIGVGFRLVVILLLWLWHRTSHQPLRPIEEHAQQ